MFLSNLKIEYKLFLFLLVCNIIIYPILNFSIKKFDYSSIIIEIDKNNYRDNIADLWLERFLAEIDYFKINHKRSQFIVFDRIQKWDIEDNKLLYEKVGSLNDTQLKEQVDFNFSLEKKEYIFIQYFKYEGQNIEFGKIKFKNQ